MSDTGLPHDPEDPDQDQHWSFLPGWRDPKQIGWDCRKQRRVKRVVENDPARWFGGAQFLDRYHNHAAEHGSRHSHYSVGIEAAAEWLKHDQYAAKPSKSDRDTLPPRNFAQKQESQQYHEQWPRKLQRHGIRQNQVRDPEKETIVAACSPKPALEVHTGALGPDHIDAVFRN